MALGAGNEPATYGFHHKHFPSNHVVVLFCVHGVYFEMETMKFYGRDGLGSGKASAEKVVYGRFTDKITTVYDYHNGLVHAR